ncbi:MAG TPA: diguanylate cyclase [Burkholderiaceae bacterium]|nr:diguanylate cyclase [Burkholderiaceae bacterium]
MSDSISLPTPLAVVSARPAGLRRVRIDTGEETLARAVPRDAAPAISPEDWDDLCHAVETRLEDAVDEHHDAFVTGRSPHDAATQLKDTVLDCVHALRQLRQAAAQAGRKLELQVLDLQTALAQTQRVTAPSDEIACALSATAPPHPTRAAADVPTPFDLALEQSHDVKEKVKACADDLAVANDAVKKRIAGGATMLTARTALEVGETVEGKVQECADDLEEVTQTLDQGLDDLHQIQSELVVSREVLGQTEAALATAQAEERMATRRALHDATTGLPNRDLFDDRLRQAISLAERHRWTLAVMFLDLDHFKTINDTHGHAVGDLVLKEVARRLQQSARKEDTVCRNGGDEFLYLLMNPQGSENVERMAGLVAQKIAAPIDVGGDVRLVVKPSIGVAVYPGDGSGGDQLVVNADVAMYRAKLRRNGCVMFGSLQSRSLCGSTAARQRPGST